MIQTQPQTYQRLVKIAAYSATLTALLLVVIKLYAWGVTDASAMLASATDSMLDLFASLINVVILRFALAPADEEHKFGHGKAESLGGLVQAAFVSGSAILLCFAGVDRLISPREIVQTEVGVYVSILAIFLTLMLVALQRYVISRTRSVAISADSIHYQSDIVLNLGVLAALLLSDFLWIYADGIFTILVGLYLLWGSLKILWASVQHLMDRELPASEIDIITECVVNEPNVLGFHDLKTRQAGQHRFIQFHLELDGQLSLLVAHGIGEKIEQKLTTLLSPCEIIIHHDPTEVVNSKK